MGTTKFHRIASIIAKTKTSLDVYEGLFAKKEHAQILVGNFREIGESVRKGLRIEIIATCSALFVDPSKTFGKYENLSLNNLIEDYSHFFSDHTKSLQVRIFNLVDEMNLKGYRHKFIGHLGLNENLGLENVDSNITICNLRQLLDLSGSFLNSAFRDQNPEGHSLPVYYRPIKKESSTEAFLRRVNGGFWD